MANVLMIGNGRSDQTTGLLFEALAEKLRHEHTVDLVLKQGPGGAWRKVVHVLKVNLPQLKKVARSEVLVVHTAAALSIQEVLFARALRKRICPSSEHLAQRAWSFSGVSASIFC